MGPGNASLMGKHSLEMLNVGFDTNILNEESKINMHILIVSKE